MQKVSARFFTGRSYPRRTGFGDTFSTAEWISVKYLDMLTKPTSQRITQFLKQEQNGAFTYPFVGKSWENFTAPGFDNDYNTIALGAGDTTWEAAKEAIRQWQMFPGGWAFIEPCPAPIREGQVVAMVARVMGLWWLNSCRIVYTVDTDTQFGFAYGTLPGHVECGEELFMVEKLPDGRVQYVLKAFSKPRFWMARMAYPLARWHQKKFVRESKAAMQTFVQQAISNL